MQWLSSPLVDSKGFQPFQSSRNGEDRPIPLISWPWPLHPSGHGRLGPGRFVLQTAAAATAPCRHRPPFSGPNRTGLLPNSLSRQIFSCLSFRNSVPFSEFGSRRQHWPLVPTHTQLPLHSCSTCRAYCSRRSPRIRGSEAGQLGHSAALGPGQLPLSRFQEPYPGLFCNLF